MEVASSAVLANSSFVKVEWVYSGMNYITSASYKIEQRGVIPRLGRDYLGCAGKNNRFRVDSGSFEIT